VNKSESLLKDPCGSRSRNPYSYFRLCLIIPFLIITLFGAPNLFETSVIIKSQRQIYRSVRFLLFSFTILSINVAVVLVEN